MLNFIMMALCIVILMGQHQFLNNNRKKSVNQKSIKLRFQL